MKEKIPFYNIANNFFVGAVFSIASALIFHDYTLKLIRSSTFGLMKDWSLVVSATLVVAVFEIGFLLNRASSVLIAPLIERTKIWPKDKYDIDVSELSRDIPKFQSLITELILIRTHILVFILLVVECLVRSYYILSLLGLLLIVLLVLSGRKHNDKINKIRKSNAERNTRSTSSEE